MTPSRTRAAVLGRPIGHSLSPVLHRAAYRALGLAWDYQAVECGPEELPQVLARLAADHAGVSLTMPLKLAAARLAGRLDPLAERLGAVNTLLFPAREQQRWVGHNTDVAGVAAALDEAGLRPAPGPVAVLGAGGSARAVLAALAGRAPGVRLLARDPSRAAAAGELAARLGLPAEIRPLEPASLKGVSAVVSTLPPDGNRQVADRLDSWPGAAPLVDLVYEGWPTPLAVLAERSGAPSVGGLSTLVAQAAEAVALMTGRRPPLPELRAAGEAALAAR